MTDNITNGIAGVAIVSPWWRPTLESVSDLAALILPAMGVIWLIVQIWAKIKTVRKK